jgi:hypothetical protein
MLQNTHSVIRRTWRDRRRYDGRSQLGCRIRVLTAEYLRMIGDHSIVPDLMLVAAVKRAAELQALAEDCRAKAVRDGTFDPVALARIEGIADRAKRALNLSVRKPEPEMTIADYAARCAGQRAAGS